MVLAWGVDDNCTAGVSIVPPLATLTLSACATWEWFADYDVCISVRHVGVESRVCLKIRDVWNIRDGW